MRLLPSQRLLLFLRLLLGLHLLMGLRVRATLLLAAAGAASAQDVAPFPMDLTSRAGDFGAYELQPRPAELAALGASSAVDLVGVPLPGGHVVDLRLTRIDFDFAKVGTVVDGKPEVWDPRDLTLWRGTVAGDLTSGAQLALASRGCYGWIDHLGERFNVSSFVAPGRTWEEASVRIWAESAFADLRDPRYASFCMADRMRQGLGQLGAPLGPQTGQPAPGAGVNVSGLGGGTLECKVAVETDFEFFQRFGSLAAAQNYLMQLLAAVSDRYETEIDVVITYPYVQFYTANNDPWTSNVPGVHSAGDLLAQLRNYYQFNFPAGAHLMHIVSGAPLGGGVAWVDVLCNSNLGFAASTGVDGGVNFPVSQGSGNWDFIVFSHEMGHQFGTVHTHEYCPPLDSCAPPGSFGPCQSSQQCSSSGTIMSYCQLCTGGTANVTTYFHPTVRGVMRFEAENSCLPAYTGGGGCPDDVYEPNDTCAAPAPLPLSTTTGLELADADPDYFRFTVPAHGTLTVDVLFLHANGDIDAELWDPACVVRHDAGTSVTDNERLVYANAAATPVDVTLHVYNFAQVGCLSYDLSAAVVVDPCATTPDDSFEPNDGCVAAALLGPGLQLGLFASQTSPDFYAIDVPAGALFTLDAAFAHASGDLDLYLYDASVGCGTSDIARSTSTTDDEQVQWTNPTAFTRRYVAEVRVAPGSASPCNSYALAVAVGPGTGVGASYCAPAVTNSTGAPGVIAGVGSDSVGQNAFSLAAQHLPAFANGYFLVAPNQGIVPNPGGSSGNLCLYPPFGRFIAQTQNSGIAGTMAIPVDLAALPQPNGAVSAQPGETWYFQLWYRDSIAGVATSNLTDGLAVTFTQ